MCEMPGLDASIFHGVGVHWDTSKFSDTLQVVTVAGSNYEGSDGY